MTSREFRERLLRRAQRAGAIVDPQIVQKLEAYVTLLARWNEKINLTALPLKTPTDETFDRLLVEPLAAARYVADDGAVWFDLGSGGGSPAIPLKIARPTLRLTMVESKVRKAAFLREASRTLALGETSVQNVRFEELVAVPSTTGIAGLVTVRAVRVGAELFRTAGLLLGLHGRLLLFRTSDAAVCASGFVPRETIPLTESPRAYLTALERVFHVEQTG